MSSTANEDLKLSFLPPDMLNNVHALANPPRSSCWGEPTEGVVPVSPPSVTDWFGIDGLPEAGETYYVVGADNRVFDSGAVIMISYQRNDNRLDCPENEALASPGRGLVNPTVVEQILAKVEAKPGWQTSVFFKTLSDGSFDIETLWEPLEIPGHDLINPIPLPSVLLSSLRRRHVLYQSTNVFLVQMMDGDLPSADLKVFKASNGIPSFLTSLEFMVSLPDVDFLVRPTHLVLDETGRLRGFLMENHRASSLRFVMDSLHPNIHGDHESSIVSLPPFRSAENTTVLALAGAPSIAWAIKLAWIIDITASVAWLHARGVFWGDLKTENIVLCADGHCRLIDYFPDGHTSLYGPPELKYLRDEWVAMKSPVTSEHDVFALGLVLWAVAEEVARFRREEDYVRPHLPWRIKTPQWFVQLALSCVQDEVLKRPSSRYIYDTLVANYQC